MGCEDIAVLDREPSALVWALSSLSRDGDLLEGEGGPSVDFAVLEDCCTIAEDEVDGAVDVALTVELAEGMGVECVLVALDAASEEGGLVRVDTEGHGLVVLGPCCVSEGHVSCDEAFA